MIRLALNQIKPAVVMRGIKRAGKHKVMPDQQAHFRTHVIEPVGFILAAAPDADHVHVRRDRRGEQVAHGIGGCAGGQSIGRNPVGAAHEHLLSVHTKGKTIADLVRIGDQVNLAETDPAGSGFCADADRQIIQGLITMRPDKSDEIIRSFQC